jgi:hypothetical protein
MKCEECALMADKTCQECWKVLQCKSDEDYPDCWECGFKDDKCE